MCDSPSAVLVKSAPDIIVRMIGMRILMIMTLEDDGTA
jgi:hypothetical protein